jgi:hypothetical protein
MNSRQERSGFQPRRRAAFALLKAARVPESAFANGAVEETKAGSNSAKGFVASASSALAKKHSPFGSEAARSHIVAARAAASRASM